MVSIEVKEIVTFDFLNKGPLHHSGEERDKIPCTACAAVKLSWYLCYSGYRAA